MRSKREMGKAYTNEHERIGGKENLERFLVA